jgi:hypothetical protein
VVIDVLDKEAEEVDHPNVVEIFLIDDINDDIENDVDDDVDMNDPFNIIDFELDHIQMLIWMKKKMNDL